LTSLENTSMFKKIFCSTRSLNDDSCLLFVWHFLQAHW
jgi:hypothetical protein